MSADPLERLKAELARPPFHSWFKPEAVAATADAVTICLRVRDDMTGGVSPPFVHGGLVAALIDVAGYAAAACATGRTTPTVNLQVDYLRPAIGDLLTMATVRHRSKRMARVDVEVTSVEGVVALGRGTFAILEESQ